MPALDGLRAVAVLLVILFHWPFPGLKLTVGWAGVQVFFVLSGFLITRILLADAHHPPSERLKRFYLKRVLRIFPLYFAYLALAHVASVALAETTPLDSPLGYTYRHWLGELDLNWGYLVTYSYNYMNWGNWLAGASDTNGLLFMHLWSLSLEEQFYLFFPFVLLAVRGRRRLAWVAAAVVVGVPILRALGIGWATGAGATEFQAAGFVYRQTQFQADALALGALLACVDLERVRRPGWLLLAVAAGVAAISALNALDLGLSWRTGGLGEPERLLANGRHIYGYTLVNGLAAATILWIVRRGGRVPVLGWRPVAWVGRVSYGIYVWHMVVLLIPFVLSKTRALDASGWAELPVFLASMAAILALSWLSFRFLESPFLKFKPQVAPPAEARAGPGAGGATAADAAPAPPPG
jgi:peptidoglycan/LPS O-acetylase OafA/YrhL